MEKTVTKEYLQWLKNEFEQSPFWQHMDVTFRRLEPGNVVIQMPAKTSLMNSNGSMHGGAIVTVLDSIIGATIRSSSEVRVVTISLTTQFAAPVTKGMIYATADIVNPGNKIQYVESKVFNDEEELIGTALGTFKVRPVNENDTYS